MIINYIKHKIRDYALPYCMILSSNVFGGGGVQSCTTTLQNISNIAMVDIPEEKIAPDYHSITDCAQHVQSYIDSIRDSKSLEDSFVASAAAYILSSFTALKGISMILGFVPPLCLAKIMFSDETAIAMAKSGYDVMSQINHFFGSEGVSLDNIELFSTICNCSMIYSVHLFLNKKLINPHTTNLCILMYLYMSLNQYEEMGD